MPRNGSGVYSKPAGTTAVADTLIESAKYNQTIDDLVADANEARPITAGGTGGVTAIAGCDNLSTKGADIASATTTDIGAATGRYINITGTTTITGLGTKTAGVVRICTFTGALTLTHNATSLILPGAANITTAAGDIAEFISEGSGNWRCVRYQYSAFRGNGGVVETGSNADGEYTKFADGTMICISSTFTAPDVSSAVGSVFASTTAPTWTFPAAFSANPFVTANDTGSTNVWAGARPLSTTTASIRLWSATSQATTRNIRATAIGRWF